MEQEDFFDTLLDISPAFKDIDFISHPIFSKRYVLRSENENKIRQIFSEYLLVFLEKVPKSYAVEAKGKYLLVHQHGKKLKVKEIEELINFTLTLVSLLKS